jgi:hypothetical protein
MAISYCTSRIAHSDIGKSKRWLSTDTFWSSLASSRGSLRHPCPCQLLRIPSTLRLYTHVHPGHASSEEGSEGHITGGSDPCGVTLGAPFTATGLTLAWVVPEWPIRSPGYRAWYIG